MFIKNHFYKLCKELPKTDILCYGTPIYSTYGSYSSNIYVTTYNQYGGIFNQYYTYQAPKNFTLNKMYQAYGNSVLYDDMGTPYRLAESDIECFEEIDIGMSDVIKKFVYELLDKKEIAMFVTFFPEDTVSIKMTKHTSVGYPCATIMGNLGSINDLVQQAYKKLREAYANNISFWIKYKYTYLSLFRKSWAYDFETNGMIGGRF